MMDWKLLHLLYTKNVGLYSFFHFLKKNQIILVGLNPTTYTLKKKCWLMGLMKS